MGLHALATKLALLLAIGSLPTRAESSLDDFTADGATTYCKLTNGLPTAPYEALKTTSVGKCPVIITMSVSLKSYTALTTVFDVSWNVTMNADRSDDEFPLDVFENTLVTGDSVIACKVDSKCTDEDGLVMATAIGPDDAFLGELDVTNLSVIAVMTYRLRLPPTGDYVIVGDITTASPGENLIDNYVFQRVSTVGDVDSPPGTVKPAPVGFLTPTINEETASPTLTEETTSPAIAPVATTAPLVDPTQPVDETPTPMRTPVPSIAAQAAGDDNTIQSRTASSSSHDPGNAMTAGILAGVAVAALVAAAIYYVVSHKRNE